MPHFGHPWAPARRSPLSEREITPHTHHPTITPLAAATIAWGYLAFLARPDGGTRSMFAVAQYPATLNERQFGNARKTKKRQRRLHKSNNCLGRIPLRR